MSPIVPTTTCWALVAPPRMTAAGVRGSRPAAIRRDAMAGSAETPMSTISVSTAVARRSQTTRPPGLSGSSWPVTTANDDDSPR